MPNDFRGQDIFEARKGHLITKSGGVALLDVVDEISVGWEIAHGSEEDCRQWVKKNRLFVNDFEVDKVQLTGHWRSSDFEISQKYKSIGHTVFIQTFRRGYATSANNQEAFVFALQNTPEAPLSQYVITYPSVAPSALQSVVDTLSALGTVENPTYGRTKLTGKWAVSGVSERSVAEDGIHNITMTLTKLNTVDNLNQLDALNGTVRDWETYLKHGEWENGRESGKEFTWQGIDPQSGIVGIITDDPSAFVNKFIETVNEWSGLPTEGELYAWVPESGGTDWVSRKHKMSVEARAYSFTMSPTNYNDALEKGWVTEAWEPVLPIRFEEQQDGTATLIVRAVDHRWDNVRHDGSGNVLADAVIRAKANQNGHNKSQSRVFTGLPSTIVPELLENITPEGTHVIGGVEISQSGDEAQVAVSEGDTFTYTTGTPVILTNGPTRIRTWDDLEGLVQIVDYYPRIDESNIDDHVTAALESSGLESGFFVQRIKRDENPDGSYNLTRTQALDQSDGTSAYYYEDDPLYEHKRIYRTIKDQKYYADVVMRYRIRKDWSQLNGWIDYGGREVKSTDPTTVYFEPGYAMDGSYYRNDGKNLFFFKKVYAMYERDANGDPDESIYPNGVTMKNITWTPVSTTVTT
jgi:hypothetical protein